MHREAGDLSNSGELEARFHHAFASRHGLRAVSHRFAFEGAEAVTSSHAQSEC